MSAPFALDSIQSAVGDLHRSPTCIPATQTTARFGSSPFALGEVGAGRGAKVSPKGTTG